MTILPSRSRSLPSSVPASLTALAGSGAGDVGRLARRYRIRIEAVAILTVYVVRDDADAALLELQLDRIARHTSVPFTIHAVARRVPEPIRERLRRHPAVRLLDPPVHPGSGSREHAAYLDLLLADARAGHASHFVTFDLDSFPIADDWLDRVDAVRPGAPVAGILRVENGDVCLPHPSCTVLTREFVETHDVSFSPDSDRSPEFRRFLRATGQAGDTGLQLAFTLWREQIPWGHLRRTNAVNLHDVIAGIYADAVFHLGAGTRDALFRADLRGSRIHRVTAPIERLPVGHGVMRDVKRGVLRRFRAGTEARLVADNHRAAVEARQWLLRDSDGLIAHLRGRPAPASNSTPES
jgi:hypothetical protein